MSFIVPSNFRQLPNRWEMAQPFRIDVAGQIAIEQDPGIWARDHILALLLTSMGERVMRPTYGAGLRAFVFEKNDPFVEAEMITNIKTSLAAWEPNISIMEINVVPQPPDWAIYEIRMSFTVGASPTRYSYQYSIGGLGAEVG